MIIDTFQTIACILIIVIAIPVFLAIDDTSLRIFTIILAVIGFVFSWDIGYFLCENVVGFFRALYTIALLFASAIGAGIVSISPIIVTFIIVFRLLFR